MNAGLDQGTRHFSKPSLLSAAFEYELQAAGIVRRRRGREEIIAYSDITHLRLAPVFDMSEGEGGQCSITSKGARWVVASGQQGFLVKHEDPASYSAFVRELTEHVSQARPSARIEIGLGRGTRAVWCLLAGVSFLILIGILLDAIQAGPSVPNALTFVAVAALGSKALAMARKKPSGGFDRVPDAGGADLTF
ncbi:hypothetical protein ACRAWG_35160 [Methylobacterium sp. P31]